MKLEKTYISNKYFAGATLLFIFFFAMSSALSRKSPEKYDEALNLYMKGEYENSLAVIRSVFDSLNRPYQMRMLAAANYVKLNKSSSAVEHLTWCIKENPKRPEPRVFLVGVFRKTKNYDKGLQLAAKSIAALGENIDLRKEMARINYALGRHQEARRQVEIILRLEKNNVDALYLDGLIFLKQRRLESSEFRFRQALAGKPKDRIVLADLYNNLGYVLESKGDELLAKGSGGDATASFQEAAKMYRFAIGTRAEHPRARKNLERLEKKLPGAR